MCTVILGAALSGMASYGAATYVGMTGAALVAATAAGAASGAQAGADYEAAEFNEDVAKQNAKRLKAQARNERIAGSVEAQRKTIQTRQATSRAAVELAGRGLDIGAGGTAEDLLAQNQQVGALDSMTILSNANRRAFGLESEAQYGIDKAKMGKRKARMGMFQSVLGSAAKPVMMGAV
ncbi:hypothetical protein ABKY54_004544 [Vibrio harveyi]